jgi:hypothetical protein
VITDSHTVSHYVLESDSEFKLTSFHEQATTALAEALRAIMLRDHSQSTWRAPLLAFFVIPSHPMEIR